ncbi:Proteophosphoglycan ppg4 [Paramicrosporidium saccamoebae]|uniref:Proteophosphoglycan ppg4 n=1 Tax=Paramicrosporidium saccamoebae TaxID=1246581 RepID=A0A2H9TJ36_9FUNG|nr:Proteophosphoglycan ppg4 [Paramicrosporidium saccamoebae]
MAAKGKSRTWPAYLVLLASTTLNVLLLVQLFNKNASMDEMVWQPVYRSWPGWLSLVRPDMKNVDLTKLDAPPTHRGKLSHVLFTMRDTMEDFIEFQETLEYWKKYPPCLVDSYPTNTEQSDISLVIYYDAKPARKTLRRIVRALNNLPSPVKSCFAQVQIRHAGLMPLHSLIPEAERAQWRSVFTSLLTNTAAIEAPNHVLILSSACRPVQPDWLNHVDYQTRPPNEHAWIRGSAFLGYTETLPTSLGELVRISPAGLYFLGDSSFAQFYMTRVRPWYQTTEAPLGEFNDRWALDMAAYLARDTDEGDWMAVTHQFRHASFIADYSGRTVSLEQIHRDRPDTVLVCARNIVP